MIQFPSHFVRYYSKCLETQDTSHTRTCIQRLHQHNINNNNINKNIFIKTMTITIKIVIVITLIMVIHTTERILTASTFPNGLNSFVRVYR